VSDELEALSKAGGEILNDPSVREFIGRVTGEPATELGGLMGDRIRYWRFKQWVKLYVRAKELLDDAGLEAHEVPPAVLVPVLDHGSLADDESPLQERWAALLANAVANPSAIPPSFPYILGQLDPTDAKLLDAVYAWGNVPGRDWQEEGIDARVAAGEIGIEGRDFELALDNLIRLRMINTQATYGGLVGETVLLTTLGSELVRACKPPGTGTEPSPRATVRPPGRELDANIRRAGQRQ
jgi:hypothetical protein